MILNQAVHHKNLFRIPSTTMQLSRCSRYHFFITSPRPHSPKNSLASRTSPTYNPCVHMIFSDESVDSFRFALFFTVIDYENS